MEFSDLNFDTQAAAVTLVIEDSPSDVLLIQQALREHGLVPKLLVARDGDEAIKLFNQIDTSAVPCPELVILDINLPKLSGLEVLSHIRTSPKCGRIPVAILTSSNALKDQQEATRRGATAYIVKPSNLDDFMKIGARLRSLVH